MRDPQDVAALLAELSALVGSPDDWSVRLDDLQRDLHAASRTFCGLRLIVVSHGWPVVLTDLAVIDHEPVSASLRLPLPAVDPAFEAGSEIVFFARAAGAFDDLAADLAHVLQIQVLPDAAHPGSSSAIVLDADLQLGARASSITGLSELSLINRAAGRLIEQGHDHAEVYPILYRLAREAGLDAPRYAAVVLEAAPRESG